MNRDNIKLAINTKLIVRFEDLNAKECTSKYHDDKEYRYSVLRADTGAAAFLYVLVDCHLAIRRANVSAGDDVELLKTMRMGQAQYGVTILGDAYTDAETTRVMRTAPASAPGVYAPASAPRQALPQQQPAATRGATALAPVAQPIAEVHPLEQIMARCFVVGGRALWTAYTELQALGCNYDQPTIEDARAAGISMFIERTRNQQNGGGR
jgi:hypothetical protein